MRTKVVSFFVHVVCNFTLTYFHSYIVPVQLEELLGRIRPGPVAIHVEMVSQYVDMNSLIRSLSGVLGVC